MKKLACIRCAGLAGRAPQRGSPLLQRSGLPLTSLMEYDLLRATIRGLRCHVPTAYPTVVRSGEKLPPDTDAYCTRTQSRFVITLGQHLGPKAATEALVHEWAHARAWNHRHDRAVADAIAGSIDSGAFEELVHDGTWGVEFAACWRVFTGVVLPAFSRRRG